MGQIDNRGSSARSAGSAKNCSSDFGGSQSSPIRGIGCNATESYSKDTDLLAHAASALRRLHFKSAGGSRSCRTVPKVVIMGSSTASETTINTSTDSANTQVTLITTTDSEQHDDSMDLADDSLELSPPAVSNSTSTIEKGGGKNAEASFKSSTISTSPHTTGPTTQSSPSQTLFNNEISSVNGGGAPPPTPLIGARHENKFLFNVGRTPPLPDLRTAEFFSTPVRGSVDAGLPDSNQLNSMLALIAAKENAPTTEEETLNHINPASNTTMKNTEPLQQSVERDKSTNGDGSAGKIQKTSKPSINVTTNPLDISLCAAQPPCAVTQPSTGSKGRCKPPGNTSRGTKRTAQATIVVQQPSLSLDAPAATILLRPEVDACRREENMRQLLDVTHTLTLQEIHDFEMRYGSPHHSRSQSVKTPGSRSSGRPNYLCLPQQRSRVASMPNTGVEEEYYRLRHFSITGKGIVNRGDSLKSRRSRSNNSVASSNSRTNTTIGSEEISNAKSNYHLLFIKNIKYT